ncbi:MAG: DUF349 domain-containing protein [Actinobacteria bacterium]|nr:DUF349 domain-containing protein [Actinomycetota bacterium]
MSEWGRIDDEGTVYVRTEDGERAVGSWQAGTAAEGLAHFARRFEVLSTEVALLEQRLRTGVGDPQQVASSAQRLQRDLPTAPAVGDLAALERRVQALLNQTAAAVEAGKAKKAEARAQAAQAKAALAEQAEALAGSSEWKVAGERLRALGEEWKRLPHLERTAEDELWQRVAAARKRFTERRTAHFAALEQQRGVSQERKEKLIAEAESLSSSTEWGPTAGRYKQLMTDWKTAGRAPREAEDALWARFKAAQDVFFSARNAHFSGQDEELRGNQKLKEEILAEAETIDPAQGPDKAKARLRTLQERWERAGKVPRDVMRSLEDRMSAVEEKVRAAGETRWLRSEESPFTARLREKVVELEGKLAKARAAGRPTAELEAALTTQQQWLAQAGGGAVSPAPVAPAPTPVAKKPKSTGGWVRADEG